MNCKRCPKAGSTLAVVLLLGAIAVGGVQARDTQQLDSIQAGFSSALEPFLDQQNRP